MTIRARRLVPSLAAAAVLCSAIGAHANVKLQLLATDPQSPATLGNREQLSLRISYSSDRPIRIRALALSEGKVAPDMSGGSPLYEASQGEAFYWLAPFQPQNIDGLRILAEDPRGHVLAESVVPVHFTWIAETDAARVPAAWVSDLKSDYERRIQARAVIDRSMQDRWFLMVLGAIFIASVPIYFVVQIVLLLTLRGGPRKAAAVPLVPMFAVVLYTAYAYHAGSNLFPILLIFLSPLAVIYLVVVAAASRRSKAVAR
ncbi:MAG TPA: hypothetical protein VE998_09305 [Terriglobales bacterium]|nr:hypothetical protein [Terriglobales bacterium]